MYFFDYYTDDSLSKYTIFRYIIFSICNKQSWFDFILQETTIAMSMKVHIAVDKS